MHSFSGYISVPYSRSFLTSNLHFISPSVHASTSAPRSRRNTLSIPQVPFHEYSHCSFLSLSSGIYFLPAASSPHKKDHRISPPPISCAVHKICRVDYSCACGKCVPFRRHSFRSVSYLNRTNTSFCLHCKHTPQHRTA